MMPRVKETEQDFDQTLLITVGDEADPNVIKQYRRENLKLNLISRTCDCTVCLITRNKWEKLRLRSQCKCVMCDAPKCIAPKPYCRPPLANVYFTKHSLEH